LTGGALRPTRVPARRWDLSTFGAWGSI
jgi:hypothetical protein